MRVRTATPSKGRGPPQFIASERSADPTGMIYGHDL